MAQAYCTLVNDGTFVESRTYSQVLNSNGDIVLDNPIQQRDGVRATRRATCWT